MTDPLDALRAGVEPVDPDPRFAAALRERLRRALLDRPGGTMTTTEAPKTAAEPVASSLTPYLAVADAPAALDWYVTVFGARRRGEPYVMPDGSIGHAELVVGNALLMLSEATGDTPVAPPSGNELPSHSIHLTVPDVDQVVRVAESNGARVERRPVDQPYGRSAAVLDPFGHRWLLMQLTDQPAERDGHGDIGYVSMIVPDDEMAREFYGAVLGWQFTSGRAPRGWNVPGVTPMTGLRGDPDAMPGAQLCFRVRDIQESVTVVRANGGTAEQPQHQGYGWLAQCQDNQGQAFALLQLG